MTEKPGRNDPCYCGSGKKYKQCHMAADLAAEREQRAWNDAARELRLDILEYADDERFDEAAGAAAARYWNELYSAETMALMSVSEAERFFDWFAFDYSLPAEGRIVELYHREKGGTLSPTHRALLDQWIEAAPMSGYELTGYTGQTLHLKEIASGETLDVFEPGGHGNVPVGAIILGRPVPVQGHLEFFSVPAFIPPDEIADLREKVAAVRASTGDTDRQQNVLFIHHALEQAKAAGRPPVARLDPRHTTTGVRQRMRHERVRIKGPSGLPEAAPQLVQAHRKAI